MKLSTKIILAFAIVMILVIVETWINHRLFRQVRNNTEFVATSEEIIRNSSQLHRSIIDMQSSFRGFLLTNDTAFIINYNKGRDEIAPLIVRQRKLIKVDPDQLALLDTIYQLHSEWVAYASSLISAKMSEEPDDSISVYRLLFETKLKQQVGKKLNDQIAQKFQEFDRLEYAIRSARRDKLMASLNISNSYSYIFLAITIAIGISSAFYIVRMISKRIKSMVRLAENITQGDFSIVADSSHDELTGLSTSLNIMSEKLSRNIRELEKRNNELNQFAYVVSHDLKAPVRGIHNVVQWIEEDLGHELSPQMRNYLNFIPQRTKRMEDLINGLLNYARMGEKTPPEKIDMNILVREIADAIVPREFVVDIKPLPVMYAEKLKLEQVFNNLISNSVKYGSIQKGHITISCIEFPYHYQFTVKDNGIGIDPEYHDKIFEIFQTLREKDDLESTGIGLAITKKIIDDQHGTIKVKSKAGDGAEFIFTWPRVNLN